MRGARTSCGVLLATALATLAHADDTTAPDPIPPEAPPPEEEPAEVVSIVGRSQAEELARSAEAVTVVDLAEERQQSADLGEVLARQQGVGVRRSGGLGSDTRFSLNGLTDAQVRFFVDELPPALAGLPMGIGSVPVDLVDRVEIYRGVVPIRFGADAPGGAVNLVTRPRTPGVTTSLTYEGGSFDTHRLSGHVRAADPARGWHVGAVGYFDRAENDYTIDVEVPDEQGRLTPATVRRFHDAYQAGGGRFSVGTLNRSWADELTLHVFGADVRQEIQNNVTMTEPYGEPVSRTTNTGATLTYHHTPSRAVSLRASVGYGWARTGFTDLATCVYDWFGRCGYPRSRPGEIRTHGSDLVLWDHDVTGRLHVDVEPHHEHKVSVSVAPTWFRRTGRDNLNEAGTRDPESARRESLQLVSGVEHVWDGWHHQIEQRLFAKAYLQVLHTEEALTADRFRTEAHTRFRGGIGDGFRVFVTRHLRVKASYEWATRLPSPEEQFGDGVRVQTNFELVPETSHNANLGIAVASDASPGGTVEADANGFLRFARDIILMLGTDTTYTYHNVYAARAAGVELAARWVSPGEWVTLDVNGTFLDFRNASDEGTFQDFRGDRIPNRPWLFTNATLQLGASNLAAPGDRLTLDTYLRYVHGYFRSWESVGQVDYKQRIPSQTSLTLALTYARPIGSAHLDASVEVHNVTDADMFDFFGVQRPGRAVYGKVTFSLARPLKRATTPELVAP